MVSHDFIIDTEGPIGQLGRTLVENELQGNTSMVHTYNRHSHEAGSIEQMTCDVEVEAEFLRMMRTATIRIVGAEEEPLKLLQENHATYKARESLTLRL